MKENTDRRKNQKSIIISLNKDNNNKQIDGLSVKYINNLTIEEAKNANNIRFYHKILGHEEFEEAAHILYSLLKKISHKFPNKKRHLYLDIEGHKTEQGGFDKDMYELMKYFIGTLLPFLSTIHMPLGNFENSKEQINNVPEESEITKIMLGIMTEE